jgi:hypothetical protein
MPVLLYVVYPCVLWSTWYECMTGHRPSFPDPRMPSFGDTD